MLHFQNSSLYHLQIQPYYLSIDLRQSQTHLTNNYSIVSVYLHFSQCFNIAYIETCYSFSLKCFIVIIKKMLTKTMKYLFYTKQIRLKGKKIIFLNVGKGIVRTDRNVKWYSLSEKQCAKVYTELKNIRSLSQSFTYRKLA